MLEYGTNLKDKIERVIDNRSRLITSEIGHMKCRVKQNSRSKIQERKFKRGQMSYVGEIRTVLRDYKDLLEERESLMKAEFYLGMGTVQGAVIRNEYEAERSRDRTNLHNFTAKKLDRGVENVLRKSGGYVPREECEKEAIHKIKMVRSQAEMALLTFMEATLGYRRFKGRKCHQRKKEPFKKTSIWRKIRDYLKHPGLGKIQRQFVYNSLKLIDRFRISSTREIRIKGGQKNSDRRLSSEIQKVIALVGDSKYVLRESDKKMGWSLNSVEWYKTEYERHLKSDFYTRVGNVKDVTEVISQCRRVLSGIIENHKDNLSKKELKGLNLGVMGEYVLPSLNLMPKGRFTRYNFVACDMFTTSLRHESFRVNETYNLLTIVVYDTKNVVGF